MRTLFAMRLQCARLGMTALCLYSTILLLCATFRLSSLDLQTPIYIFSICDAASIPGGKSVVDCLECATQWDISCTD